MPAFISTIPEVVTSISDELPARLTPEAPSIVRAPAVVVRLLAAPASIDTAAPASIATPPAVALMSTAEELVPCVLVTTIVSLVPISVVSDIAEAASSFETRST